MQPRVILMIKKVFTKLLAMGLSRKHSRLEALSLHLSSAQTLIYRKGNRNQKGRMAEDDWAGSGKTGMETQLFDSRAYGTPDVSALTSADVRKLCKDGDTEERFFCSQPKSRDLRENHPLIPVIQPATSVLIPLLRSRLWSPAKDSIQLWLQVASQELCQELEYYLIDRLGDGLENQKLMILLINYLSTIHFLCFLLL